MDWQWLITNVGVLGSIVLGGGYIGVRVMQWVGTEVVKPIVAAHIAYLRQMGEVAEGMGASIKELAEAQTSAAQSQLEASAELRRLAGDMTEVKKKVIIHAETAVIASRPDGGSAHGPGAGGG